MKMNKKMILIGIIGLIFVGSIWEQIMVKHEREKYPPVGNINLINGHKIHTYTKGTGDMAAVFITGSGTPCAYTDFYALQEALSSQFKTVSFDKAGYGWSEPTNVPRTIENLVSDLEGIFNQTAEEGILICHSLGSLEAIRFAQVAPERIKGIIFLDCGSPQFYSEKESESQAKLINRVSGELRIVGMNRLLGNMGFMLPLSGENVRYPLLPNKEQAIDEAMYYRYIGNSNNLSVLDLINENGKLVAEGETLGDLPILVLSSDAGKDWEDVQKELAAWSTNSKQITIESASHYIHWSNQERVLEEIQEFIRKIQEER